MVNLHFPPNLTDEELMLQTKYEKLRKKKKALENHKSPKVEVERPVIKRPKIEAKNAREIAKKLLKSGAIAAIQKTQRREDQGSGFKRPCGLERKLERNTCSSYQPFNISNNDGDDRLVSKKLLTNNSTNLEEVKDDSSISGPKSFKPSIQTSQPKTGNTIFVSVINTTNETLTEDLITSTFSPCGNIVNINLEVEKNRGFVTFDSTEAAAQAIATLNGTIKENFHLKVSYARRQPSVFRTSTNNDSISSSSTSSFPIWSNPGANQATAKKDNPKDSRKMVDYGDNYFDD